MIKFSYLNPHAWISVEVATAGIDNAAGRWDIEATSTAALARIGLSPDSLKPGDKLTVGIRPLRDNRRGGSMVFIVDSVGKVFGANPEDLGLKIIDLKPK
jgi:hypothetical protein